MEVELHDVDIQPDYRCWIIYNLIFSGLQKKFNLSDTYFSTFFSAYMGLYNKFLPGIYKRPVHADVSSDSGSEKHEVLLQTIYYTIFLSNDLNFVNSHFYWNNQDFCKYT